MDYQGDTLSTPGQRTNPESAIEESSPFDIPRLATGTQRRESFLQLIFVDECGRRYNFHQTWPCSFFSLPVFIFDFKTQVPQLFERSFPLSDRRGEIGDQGEECLDRLRRVRRGQELQCSRVIL